MENVSKIMNFPQESSKTIHEEIVDPKPKNVKDQMKIQINNTQNESQQLKNTASGSLKEAEARQSEEQILKIGDKRIRVSELKRVGVLGNGSSGVVEKAIHEQTGIVLGIKCIPLRSDEQFRQQLDQEINTLVQCNSESIVKCYGAYIQKCTINIALEYMDLGTVHDLIAKIGPLPENILAILAIQVNNKIKNNCIFIDETHFACHFWYSLQVLQGLDYIHNQAHVIHRDIKPSNLLVNSRGQVKIADFGVSANAESANENKNWAGTYMYMSPERFFGLAYSFNTDIWSLGLTICECALGTYPYSNPQGEGKEDITISMLTEQLNSKPNPKLPDSFSTEMKDFISLCFKKSPLERPQSKDLLEHPMVKKYSKLSSSDFEEWIHSKNIKSEFVPTSSKTYEHYSSVARSLHSSVSSTSSQNSSTNPSIPPLGQELTLNKSNNNERLNSNPNSCKSPQGANSNVNGINSASNQAQVNINTHSQGLVLDSAQVKNSSQLKPSKSNEKITLKYSQQQTLKPINKTKTQQFDSKTGIISGENQSEQRIQEEVQKYVDIESVNLRQLVSTYIDETLIDSFILGIKSRVKQRIFDQLPQMIQREFKSQLDSAFLGISNQILSSAFEGDQNNNNSLKQVCSVCMQNQDNKQNQVQHNQQSQQQCNCIQHGGLNSKISNNYYQNPAPQNLKQTKNIFPDDSNKTNDFELSKAIHRQLDESKILNIPKDGEDKDTSASLCINGSSPKPEQKKNNESLNQQIHNNNHCEDV